MIKLSKVALDLGVTKPTLWNWMHEGKIKFHKRGNLNFIDIETYNKLFSKVKENLSK